MWIGDMSHSTAEGDGNRVAVWAATFDGQNGFVPYARRVTPLQIPCPTTSGYWGDYDQMGYNPFLRMREVVLGRDPRRRERAARQALDATLGGPMAEQQEPRRGGLSSRSPGRRLKSSLNLLRRLATSGDSRQAPTRPRHKAGTQGAAACPSGDENAEVVAGSDPLLGFCPVPGRARPRICR